MYKFKHHLNHKNNLTCTYFTSQAKTYLGLFKTKICNTDPNSLFLMLIDCVTKTTLLKCCYFNPDPITNEYIIF